ncbi:MAG TPA: PBP1A family penicillin-binding protein [Pyrinomonadaceae bacterium]|nr:PBP1A family penicillin-binding protein [Pyrinomonadaceae bacterium]
MPVRHPPENSVPPVARSGGRGGGGPSRRPPRVVKFEEPPTGFFRRWARRIFRPPVVIALIFLTTLTIGVFGYYWWIFSGRIDRLLNGEVFTRSAGIYAAPKELRVGENISVDELIAYLKRAGYVEKTQQADSSRGRYSINGANVDIEPSKDATLDGQKTFPRLRVQFARGGKSIATIMFPDGGARYDKAQLEPEKISSVTGTERAKRRIVGFNDLPPHLIKAITVTEDRSFFDHYGVNIRGILRALIRRYEADPNSPIARQGGSSITQQLVKNLLLSPERTWRRKFAEAYMSVIIETRLSKEQIFALYCNEVYLGQQAGFSINGFGEAADAYFSKDVTTLTLPESAFLAGIIRSPNRYNPYHNIETATARRNQVLQSMAETGAITQLEAAQAQNIPLKVAATKGRVDASDAPYFADYVQNQLDSIIGDASASQHLRVYTTIDMDLQRAAYAAVTKQLAALDKLYAKRVEPGTLQAAMVAMNAHTGEIVAMVGGRDYTKSQLNRVSDAMRQPGSVFKPFVYATALNTAYDPIPRVITPATIYTDEPKTFTFDNQEYSPGNFGDDYSNGPVTLRDALVKSLNVVTVDVAMEVTIGRVMNLAAKAGLPPVKKAYPAMALGASEATPLQIASAYTAFAASGTRTTPIAINRVTTGNGTTVAAPTSQKNDVLRPDVAYVMTSMLKDVVNRGTAARLGARGFKNVAGRIGIAGKTGTSRDGWFAGFTPNLVCVVWVGFDDGSQLGLTGAEAALPIWADFMSAALADHPEWNGDWAMPEGIEQAEIDTRTGGLATEESTSTRTEFFINGTAPRAPSDEPLDDGTTTDETEPETDPNETDAPPLPEESPAASPRRSPSRPDGRAAPLDDGAARLGTITLDIDPTTGLIADPAVCPVIRTKTFALGQEPRQFCGPQYHGGGASPPTATRPRRATP